MKKNIIKLGLVSICLIGSIYFYLLSNSDKNIISNLALANTEALANGEYNENFDCIGYGDIDCYGYKVARKYTGLRLD